MGGNSIIQNFKVIEDIEKLSDSIFQVISNNHGSGKC